MDDARAAERLGWARVGAERDIATGEVGERPRRGASRGARKVGNVARIVKKNPFQKFTLAAGVPSLLQAIAVLRTLVGEPFSL